MVPELLRQAVSLVTESGQPVETEASGEITLETVGEVERTGVDFISVGAITHSAPALDLSLLIEL
jgi:nicotinate-nucleotide pyrophosphorylase (carboxylating)